MYNKTKIINLMALVMTLTFFSCQGPDYGVVDLSKVEREFNAFIELRQEIQLLQEKRKEDLLAMENELKRNVEEGLLKSAEDSTKHESKYIKWLEGTRNLEEDANNHFERQSAKIWNDLNSSMREFSRENQLGLLHGANGDGGILYVDSNRIFTEAFIEFANKSYEDE